MRAKSFLMQVRKLDRMIENKLAELAQWQAMATSTTGTYGSDTGVRVQSSGNQQRMEAAIVKYIDIEAKAEKQVELLMQKKQDVIGVIEQLDFLQYDVLHKMYIGVVVVSEDGHKQVCYKSLQDIADIYDRSYSWAKNTRGKALKNVQKILDAREAEP